MARSNGQTPVPPPPHLGEAAPQWRHPSDPGNVPAHHDHSHAGLAHPSHAHPVHGYPQPGFAPSPDLPPYGQQPDPYGQPPFGAAPPPTWAAHAQHHPHQGHQPHAAPGGAQGQHGYDLGHYGHGAQPQTLSHDPYAQQVTSPPWASAQAHPQDQTTFDPSLPSPQSFAEPVPGQRMTGYPAPSSLAAAIAATTGPAARPHDRTQPPSLSHTPSAPVQAPDAQETYDDEYDEEFEDEPKRGRKLMVVGALVGAICVGGGLAYAYKAFSGGKTPLVNNAQKAPAKAPAAQQQKVAAKLPEAVPTPTSPATADEGPRRVQTIAVVPPGGAAVAPPQPTPPPNAAVMPGMVLDNFPRAGGNAPQAAPIQPTAPLRPSAPATPPAAQVPTPQKLVQPPVAAPAPPQPKVAIVNPQTAPNPQAPSQTATAPERRAAPVPKREPDAYSPNALPGSTGGVVAQTPPPGGSAPAGKSSLGANGYVATVLSTQRGRPEAMKAFADLQQKFPDVLGAKPAEVQEKDLGDKGKWYRAVVGPPGSRDAATQVCVQLKASGYGQCFVTAY